eukprot:Rmarinus@m.21373
MCSTHDLLPFSLSVDTHLAFGFADGGTIRSNDGVAELLTDLLCFIWFYNLEYPAPLRPAFHIIEKLVFKEVSEFSGTHLPTKSKFFPDVLGKLHQVMPQSPSLSTEN